MNKKEVDFPIETRSVPMTNRKFFVGMWALIVVVIAMLALTAHTHELWREFCVSAATLLICGGALHFLCMRDESDLK